MNKAQQLIEMESSQPISLEERQGTMQKAESGNQGNRNQYEGWDIPRPGTQHSRRSGKDSLWGGDISSPQGKDGVTFLKRYLFDIKGCLGPRYIARERITA